MANTRKNKAARSTSYDRRPQPAPRWLSVSWGIVLGLLGAGILFIILSNKIYLQKAIAWLIPVPTPITAKMPAKAHTQVKRSSQPNFEFYTLLPEMEIQLPDPQPSPTAPPKLPQKRLDTPLVKNELGAKKAPQQPKEPKTLALDPKEPSQHHYLLQAGAFRTLQEADAIKAGLLLQGFTPHIQKVRVPDGLTFFRVILGPFPSEDLAQKQKKLLASHQIQSTVILKRHQ